MLIQTPKEPVYDVVVIGSGASGGMAAWNLTNQGARVLMLDAGTHLDASLGRVWNLRRGGAADGGWFSRMEARVAAANVRDEARFDQCGLPQPGRLLRLQLRVF